MTSISQNRKIAKPARASTHSHRGSTSQWALRALGFGVLTIFAALYLLPIVWFITSSFRTNAQVFANITPFSLKTMFLNAYRLDSYEALFSVYEFQRPLLNTLLVSSITVLLGLLIASLAGYAFAKMRFRGKKMMFWLVLFAIMVPFDAISIPLYTIVNSLKWLDTYQGLILPTLANGMVIFMFRQFFTEVNDSLIESARIDGAGEFTIFFRLALPLSKPAIISGGLVIFMAQWNAFMWPLLCGRSDQFKLIQVAMSDFRMEHGTMWAEMFAAITISMLIPCALLLPLQKYYIRGITTTGVKE